LLVAIAALHAASACEGNPVAVRIEGPEPGDTTVLFIGNSLTSYYGLPDQFAALADSQGRSVWVDRTIRTGVTLTQYLEYANVDAEIAAREWDWIILQDSSPLIAFPEYRSLYLATYTEYEEMIRRSSPGAEIVLFMLYALDFETLQDTTWAYDDLQPLLRTGAIAIADSLDFMVAPVGWAFRQVRAEYPDIPLYYLDGYHPSREAQYLQACVYYTTIFGESPEGSPFTADLADSTAARLQRIAARIVLDEAEVWNLDPGSRSWRRRPDAGP
jgi:hypothetical protein